MALSINDPVTLNGVTKKFREWAGENKINPTTARLRVVKYGWTIEKALTVRSLDKQACARAGRNKSPWRRN